MNYKKAWETLKAHLKDEKKKFEKEYEYSNRQFHKAREMGHSQEEQEKLCGYIEQSKYLIDETNHFLKFMEVLEKHS